MRRRMTVFVLAALLLPAVMLAGDSASPATDRLARLGRVWGTVRYLHPYLATRDVNWDAALLAALPKVREARTREEYRDAVQQMLDALGDPVTRVMVMASPGPRERTPAAPVALSRDAPDGVLVVELARHLSTGGQQAMFGAVQALPERIAKAKSVVVDLRAGPLTEDEQWSALYVLDAIASSLVTRPVRGPSQRYLLHSGYRPQKGASSGGYFSGVLTHAATTFDAPSGASAKKIVFILDAGTHVPAIVLALQAAGDAHIVCEGQLAEEYLVESRPVDIGEGLTARVRVSELAGEIGRNGARADVVLEPGAGASAIDAAVAETAKSWAPTAAATPVTSEPDPVFRPDRAYDEMTEPDLPHRQLAVIRAWNVIHYFYPYLHLIGDWDAVLPAFLARMEDARTSRDYALVMAEMMANVADGHTTLSGRSDVERPFGETGLPIQVRWTEGHAVVWRVSEGVRTSGLEVGDAILVVDDEPVGARVDRMSRYVTASTRPSLLSRIAGRHLLAGSAGSTARLTVQKIDGRVHEVHLVREAGAVLPPAQQGDVVRILPGNLGYVDLSRLALPDVDGMFERVKDTRGLIFDLRGYPQGTAWAIAPRINTRNATVGAQFRRAQVSAFSIEDRGAGVHFSQPLPELPKGASKYTRPTVTVIDDRAISQAEHTALFFESANGTTFVGTATAGANGDVTRFPVPGGIWIGFTGHDVRHADGRQLQRVGIVPDVEAAPTRAGLKAGVDEVLAKAIETLEKKIAGQ